MNLIQILFSLMASTMIVYSCLINFLEPKLPQFLSQCFRYGKFAAASKCGLAIEVPKFWFKHFYIFASFIYAYVLWLVIMVYICDMKVPEHVRFVLDVLCGKERIAYIPKHKVLLAVCLMSLQVYRRLYDTHTVSVFGAKSKMNVTHYLAGLIHYPGTVLAILCEAPLFANSLPSFHDTPLNLFAISLSDKIAAIIFILAWWHQYTCTKILGDLRKNKKGDIVSNEYKLPEGDWFEYLVAPHQTAEIIMYSCLMWILWNNITWFFIFAWVVGNQVETILLTHWWYQEKFDNYPKNRKALIPWLY